MTLSIWVPGARGNAPWLVGAITLMVLGSAIVLFADLSAWRPQKQTHGLPIDALLQRPVTWVAVRNRAHRYAADAVGKQWELAVETSVHGTRYILTTDGHAVNEIAYCPTGWVLEEASV
jgi:hypothetical protein